MECKNCPEKNEMYWAITSDIKATLKTLLGSLDLIPGKTGESIKAKAKDVLGFKGLRGKLRKRFYIEE